MPKTRSAGLSTRSAVIGCLRKLTGNPGLDPGPQATIAGLGVSRTGLGTCLNTELSLAGDDRYIGDEIGGDWMVQDVINDADGRRHTLDP
jgi:hypothetical protein